MPQLPTTPKIPLWENFLTVFYGGIVEKVLVRLFLMTLLVWVFSRFQKSQNKISAFIYWIAIVLSTLLFGVGHLPAVASLFGGLTPLLVIRAVINSVVIKDTSSNILVVQDRMDLWNFSGGKLELNETPSDCAKREVREEIGLNVHELTEIFQGDFCFGES